MTANQIAYLNYREGKRANQANERISTARATEEQRSNRAKEAINWYTSIEEARHNLANEEDADKKRGVDIANTVIKGVDTVGDIAIEVADRVMTKGVGKVKFNWIR